MFWNDTEIGKIAEQDVRAGVQTFTFGFDGARLDRNNSLGFRLDQFSDVQSSSTVSNVRMGYGGLTENQTLMIAISPQTALPLLTLTGAQGFTYLIESSEDLQNWEPMGAVTLDTGVATTLEDSWAAGLLKQFYRAKSP